MKRTSQAAGGFTLIELLVVVAIIAVLISILLPSLSAARKLAKRVVCSSDQRQLVIGMSTYGSEGADWIIGAPNGSGMAAYDPNLNNRTDVLPTTVWDWANPMTPYLGRTLEIPPDRLERMFKSRLDIFQCPESMGTMVQYPVHSPGPWAVQNTTSYVTLWKMLMVGDAYKDQYQQRTPFEVPWNTYASTWETKLPKHYLPRLDQVGPASRKFFLLEGTRYVTDDGIIDYDTNPTGLGAGSYSSSGPSFRDSQEYGINKPGRLLSYRHPSGQTLGLNAGFFDGHVEWMTEVQTRYHGYSIPSGSTLWNGSNFHPDTLRLIAGAYRLGDVLPD